MLDFNKAQKHLVPDFYNDLSKYNRILVSIEGYCGTIDQEVVYRLRFIEPEELDYIWLMNEQDLEDMFTHMGGRETLRFLNMKID